MKRDSMLIGLLVLGALVLAVVLAVYHSGRSARADVFAPSSDYTLLTSSSSYGNVNMLNVIDNRQGLVLIYSLNGTRLVLIHVVNLKNRLHSHSSRLR
jgi:hypothetical protein